MAGRPRPESRAATWFPWALLGVALVAVIPRASDASRYPLIFDEIYGVLLARTGFASMLHTLSLDVDQPLNFIIVWAWRALGGEGAFWLKIPSMVWGTATVVLVGLFGRALFGAGAGILAALLLAVHPQAVHFSQQARFHAFEWMLLTGIAFLAWRWVHARGARLEGVAITLAAAAALWTDYFTLFPMSAIALWGAFTLRREPRRVALWLALFAGAVLLYSPQIPTLISQIQRDIIGERLLPPMGVADVAEFLRKISWSATYAILPLLALAAWPLFARGHRAAAVMLWAVALIPIFVPWGLSQAGAHLFITRQMLFTIPLFCLLLGAGVASLPWRPVAIACGVALALFAGRACWLRAPLEEVVDLPKAIAHLKANARPGDLVACTETRALLFAWYYLPDQVDARLMIVPEQEHFHYSDGVLAIPEEKQMPIAEWRARAARGERWWGLRLPHAGRDGPLAAAALEGAAARTHAFGRARLWEGQAGK